LLADDPGADKTIMAGLLLKELKYRGPVRRTLVVVPGHLKDQWLREMKERFLEHFTIVDRSVMNATWGRNVWREQARVITERYRFGELLSRTSQFLVFLTATPHRGNPEIFRLFLDLLEPGMFANTDLLLESVQNRENPLFLRRLKEDLKDFDQRLLFPPRHVFTKLYRLNDDEKRLYNAVTEYVEQSCNKALANEKRNVAFALLILQRRLASSVRAAPADVSKDNLGYDIRSTDDNGGVRYIEVKGRAGTGAIILTPNEWMMAHRLRNEYWLYVVENAVREPRLYMVQNPASRSASKRFSAHYEPCRISRSSWGSSWRTP
jgi:SNF2 family DNA or RNA helicase